MGKRALRFVLALGTLAALTGCLSQSGEDFYALPQLPEDYVALQKTISQVMGELGAEYAAPASGSNNQNIQLQDLDGDGVQEAAVAFFRVSSAEKPLKIYVFRQNQATEEYETSWIIEGDGSAIAAVDFEDIGGEDSKEVVVRWQISAKVQSMAAYSLQPDGDVVEMMRSGYTANAVADLDRDNKKEIVLLQLDTAEGNHRAELYRYDNGMMALSSAAPLSQGLTEIQAAKVGSLSDLTPALFVSSDFLIPEQGDAGGRITDIIALRDGELVNLTLSETVGRSVSTERAYKDFQDVNGLDINNDGILEIPMPEALPAAEGEASSLYLLHWKQYDAAGRGVHVCTTFHNYDDSWYLILPEDWAGRITAARQDSGGSAAGSERAVGFYTLPDGDGGGEPGEEFLTVYRLTGTNRAARAKLDGRFILFESSDVIYAARFRDAGWDCGLDEDGLRACFNRVKAAWSSEN